MPEADTITTPPAPPTPCSPRFRWLKRLLALGLVCAVLLAGLRLVWGHRVQSRLDEAIANIQAQDEPILFEDLQFEPLPDSENGAWYLKQALAQWPVVPSNPGLRITDTDWYNEGEEAGYTDPITDNAAYLKSCEAVFDLLRQSDQQQQSAWGPGLTRPLLFALRPHLGDNRRLARLLDDAAYRALDEGDTLLVLESMLMQHSIARHMHGQHAFIIDSLVAISVMAMNREFIERALPKIDPTDLREGPAREMAKQIIARLTDGMLRDGFTQGFVGERAASYDIYECLIDGTDTAANLLGSDEPLAWVIDTPGLSYAYRPALKNAQHLSTQFYSEVIGTLHREAHLNEVQSITAKIETIAYESSTLYPLLGILLPAYYSANTTYLRSETMLRLAAVAIAIKLYEADHGKRPDTLDQLTPDYIPAIPTDPFSPTGDTIRYNPKGVVPGVTDNYRLTDQQNQQLKQTLRPYPVLYSIGEDGKDHNGGPLFVHPEGDLSDYDRYPSPENGEAGDIWFMLDAWPEAVFEESDLGDENDPFNLETFE